MRNILKKLLPVTVKSTVTNLMKVAIGGSKDVRLHYSDSGEDLQIYNTLKAHRTKGTYVDVGAYHPTHLSNTYLLYINGWRGINIDAAPDSMKRFNKTRPLDINIQQAVSDKEEELVFYENSSKAESSFDTNFRKQYDKSEANIVREIRLKTKTLNQILSENNIVEVDVLSIDAEGFDYRILKVFNFEKHKPTLIVVEQLADSIEEILESDTYKLLKEKNYVFFGRTLIGDNVGTSVYKRKGVVL